MISAKGLKVSMRLVYDEEIPLGVCALVLPDKAFVNPNTPTQEYVACRNSLLLAPQQPKNIELNVEVVEFTA